MNYAGIKTACIENGPGLRTSLFVSGCRNHCEGCFNKETWDFHFGHPFDDEAQMTIIRSLEVPYISGLTVLGGEPMEPENQAVLRPFLQRVKKIPGINIWIYSGYTWEELVEEGTRCHTDDTLPILKTADVLVDGKFILGEKDITLRFRGSRNQRVVDIQKSLLCSHLVLCDY